MKFTPRTEKEVSRIFEKGDYRFTVSSALEKVSKSSGNQMIHLKLVVYHSDIPGKTTIVDCYLLNDNPSFEYLIRHFCYSVGLGELYEQGNLLPEQCNGKEGIVRLAIEEDKTGKYPDKNKVTDFIAEKLTENSSEEKLNDDIPF
jgi:hypothetical protein